MKYIKYLLCLVAALLVLPMVGCLCSQLYTRHQVSRLMNYQGMSKDEVLRRVCDVDVAHYDAHPPDEHGFITPASKITMTVGAEQFSAESYEAIKDSPRLKGSQQWIVHHRHYGLSTRCYAVKLTFDEAGRVIHQDVTWYEYH